VAARAVGLHLLFRDGRRPWPIGAGPKSDRFGRVQLNEWYLAEQLGVSNRAVGGWSPSWWQRVVCGVCATMVGRDWSLQILARQFGTYPFLTAHTPSSSPFG
jgi:hypothetical protein